MADGDTSSTGRIESLPDRPLDRKEVAALEEADTFEQCEAKLGYLPAAHDDERDVVALSFLQGGEYQLVGYHPDDEEWEPVADVSQEELEQRDDGQQVEATEFVEWATDIYDPSQIISISHPPLVSKGVIEEGLGESPVERGELETFKRTLDGIKDAFYILQTGSDNVVAVSVIANNEHSYPTYYALTFNPREETWEIVDSLLLTIEADNPEAMMSVMDRSIDEMSSRLEEFYDDAELEKAGG